jgi:hypothetical protein
MATADRKRPPPCREASAQGQGCVRVARHRVQHPHWVQSQTDFDSALGIVGTCGPPEKVAGSPQWAPFIVGSIPAWQGDVKQLMAGAGTVRLPLHLSHARMAASYSVLVSCRPSGEARTRVFHRHGQ